MIPHRLDQTTGQQDVASVEPRSKCHWRRGRERAGHRPEGDACDAHSTFLSAVSLVTPSLTSWFQMFRKTRDRKRVLLSATWVRSVVFAVSVRNRTASQMSCGMSFALMSTDATLRLLLFSSTISYRTSHNIRAEFWVLMQVFEYQINVIGQTT